MASASLADLERVFYCLALGLTPNAVANLSMSDLETLYLAAQSGGQGFAGLASPALTGNPTVNGISVSTTDSQSPAVKALKPTAAQFETFPRCNGTFVVTTGGPVSGTPLIRAIWLPKGTVVSSINFVTVAAAVAPTHSWAALLDNNLNQLANTADTGATAIPANSVISWPIAAKASGAAISFTTTYSGLYYIKLVMVATTTVAHIIEASDVSLLNDIAPPLNGTGVAGQTVPPVYPNVEVMTSASTTSMYAYV